MPSEFFTPADAAVLETFVVPRYLSAFGRVALDMMLVGESANVAHLGCRTGFPDAELLKKVGSCRVVGVDRAASVVELARNKAAALGLKQLEYHVVDGYPTPLTGQTFSHVLTLHPYGNHFERAELFTEMSRLLYPCGQALVAMPLRGSFQELGDLFREYALKYDEGAFGQAVDVAVGARPTIETLSEELEVAGLVDVDVEVVSTRLSFVGGRAFLEDPSTRLLIVPELESGLGSFDLSSPLTYVGDAIDEYWAESEFSLTVKIGCASARRPG